MSAKNKTLKQIIEVSDKLRRKYNSIKQNQFDTQQKLEETFKPITEPLKEIIKSKHPIKTEIELQTPLHKSIKRKLTPENHSEIDKKKKYKLLDAPGTSFQDEEIVGEIQPEQSPESVVRSILNTSSDKREELGALLGGIAAEYFEFYLQADDRKKDNNYGVRRTSDGEWMIGNEKLTINKNDVNVKDKWYTGSRGLYELLFKKIPKNYTSEDLSNYIEILLVTSAHKRNYSSLSQIQGNPSHKWRNIIKPALASLNISTTPRPRAQSTTGFGLIPNQMIVTNQKPDYIYWDDANELIDRLRVLVSSKNAGHTGHDNEILSILEELREVNIIE